MVYNKIENQIAKIVWVHDTGYRDLLDEVLHYLKVYKYSKADPPPHLGAILHFGVFHEVENNFLELRLWKK